MPTGLSWQLDMIHTSLRDECHELIWRLQWDNHGNGGMSKEVYRVIASNIAFFDVPDWLMQDEGRNAPAKRALIEELGAEVLYYATAPNSVVLR
jgi:hypothetical protein